MQPLCYDTHINHGHIPMLNRFEFLMFNKVFPTLAILNLFWCMAFIITDGWSWTRGLNIIIAVMYMDWFFNADSDLYRKSK